MLKFWKSAHNFMKDFCKKAVFFVWCLLLVYIVFVLCACKAPKNTICATIKTTQHQTPEQVRYTEAEVQLWRNSR